MIRDANHKELIPVRFETNIPEADGLSQDAKIKAQHFSPTKTKLINPEHNNRSDVSLMPGLSPQKTRTVSVNYNLDGENRKTTIKADEKDNLK